MSKKIIPKTAFLSVSDKSGLVPFARFLKNKKVKIIATGGTVKALKRAGIPAVSIASITGFPEIFGGRVKSIHPKIAGGILGERDIHNDEAKKNGIEWIDLVVCNLYPFKRVAKTLGASLKEKIENIDVGGPTMIRSAAKNNKWVSVVVDPGDYGVLKKAISAGGVDERMRLSLASKAFNYCANYDLAIATELENLLETGSGAISLRYGENPHQKAFVIKEARGSAGVPQAKQLQGKELSYNNFLDSEAALLCLHEFKGSSCVIVKHGSPCGIGFGETTKTAFLGALRVDPLSAFGGVVAINKGCDLATAKELNKVFFEVVIAPAFDGGALAFFSKKKNLRILLLKKHKPRRVVVRDISGGRIAQETDLSTLKMGGLKTATRRKPTKTQLSALELAWCAVKHTKSNAIVVAYNKKIISISGGQTSRVSAVKDALNKTRVPGGCVLASDAFFPFRDSIDLMAKYKIKSIIQPGGSIKDKEVIAACDEHGISMVFTGTRVFKH